MSIRIKTNSTSLRAQANLRRTQNALATNIERLSSGLRLNRASDDAAGSSISSKLTSQTRSLLQATRNTNDAVSVIQTTEGALNEISGIVIRMRELAIQAANDGTMTSVERGYIDQEFGLLQSEVDRIVNVTEFNGSTLLDGNLSANFQVGIGNSNNDRIAINIDGASTTELGIDTGALPDIDTASDARAAIDLLDAAIQSIGTNRGALGATQNRLNITISNLSNMHENLTAANSRIKDVDVANETSEMTRNQILQQAGVAVLAQANQLPQAALSLLG